MTYIRSVPRFADTDERVSIRLGNTRTWLQDAKEQGYRNPVFLALALEELIDAIETLAGDRP